MESMLGTASGRKFPGLFELSRCRFFRQTQNSDNPRTPTTLKTPIMMTVNSTGLKTRSCAVPATIFVVAHGVVSSAVDELANDVVPCFVANAVANVSPVVIDDIVNVVGCVVALVVPAVVGLVELALVVPPLVVPAVVDFVVTTGAGQQLHTHVFLQLLRTFMEEVHHCRLLVQEFSLYTLLQSTPPEQTLQLTGQFLSI